MNRNSLRQSIRPLNAEIMHVLLVPTALYYVSLNLDCSQSLLSTESWRRVTVMRSYICLFWMMQPNSTTGTLKDDLGLECRTLMTVSPTSKTTSSHSKHPPTSSVPPPSPTTKSSESSFLATVEGEISFFRSIMRARPVGRHRYFHILAIQNAIQKETGKLLHVESIWEKLQSCYDLDALDSIVSLHFSCKTLS